MKNHGGQGRAPELFELSDVWMNYGGPPVLRGVNLTLRSGAIHALVGHNGSGKSSLIRVMAGVQRPEPGFTATLDGSPIELADHSHGESRRLHFIHQGLQLIPKLSGLDNAALGVGYPRTRGRIDWTAHRNAVRDALESIGSDIDLEIPAGELSPVNQVTLAIARAISRWDNDRCVLVLDEPTAALPSHDVERLFAVVRRAAARGAAILFVSHRLDEVRRFADEVTILREGRVVLHSAMGDLGHDALVAALYDGHQESHKYDRPPVDNSSDPALTVRNLTTAHLENVSLNIRPGEILGVAGLDGSGREEMAEAVFGVTSRAAGEVAVHGHTVRSGSPYELARRGVGLVPANRALRGALLKMTIRTNATLPSLRSFRTRFGYLDERRERRDVRGDLDTLGVIPPRTETLLGSLSGGNQQKVVVGKWLRRNVAVLLLDEPAQGIDIPAKDKIFALLRAAAGSGTAMLVCSAVDEDLCALCDRVLVLRGGVIVSEHSGPTLTPAALSAASNAFTNTN